MWNELQKLIIIYSKRVDLQKRFPEVATGNLKNLLTWASYTSQDLYDEPDAYQALKNNAEFFYQAAKYDNFLPHPTISSIPELFFIFAAGRSGTTLMKRILNSHPLLTCEEEGKGYNAIDYPLLLRYQCMFSSTKKLFGLKTIAVTESLQDENIIIQDLANHDAKIMSDKFRNLYKNNRIIFLVRDVRDRVLSMYKFRFKTSPEPESTLFYEQWIEKNPFLKEKYANDISKAKKSNNIVAYLSLDWKIKNSTYFTCLEKGYPILLVKYEDLVSNTQDTCKKITQFLGVDFDESMLNANIMPHPGLRSPNTDPNFDNVKRKPDSESIGNSMKDFNSDQLKLVMDISSDLMNKFGYKI